MTASLETLPLASVAADNASRSPSLFLDPDKGRRQPFWRTFTQLVASAARTAWHDLRTAHWAVFGLCMLYIGLLLAIAACLVALFLSGPLKPTLRRNGTRCQPDGSFSPYADRYDWWAPSQFFEVTMRLGKLRFVEVKVIDIAWQVVVGRGGQALVTLLSWRVFSDYIAAEMTRSPVTYTTFWTLFLHREPTLTSIYRLGREFCLYKSARSPFTSLFILLTAIFALCFPTFVNSMTGYVTDTGPYIEVESGNMVPFDKFAKVAYVIRDGDRIGLTENYTVVDCTEDSLIHDYGWSSNCRSDSKIAEECALLGAVSSYVSQYGFNGLQNEKTKWIPKPLGSQFVSKKVKVELNESSLPAPALDIAGFSFQNNGERGLYGYQWQDPQTGDHPFQDAEQQRYVYEGKLYSMKDIKELGDCKAWSSQEYQWGFSFLQLFIMLLALLIWSTGLWVMWHRARHRLPLENEPEVPRGWRAVLELSRAMERELLLAGIDVTTMTDRQAKREIRRRLRGGHVSFDARLRDPGYGLWSAFIALVRREKWWILFFFAMMGVPVALCLSIPMDWTFVISVACWTAGGAYFMVLWVGTTVGSRVFMLAVAGLIGVVIGASMA